MKYIQKTLYVLALLLLSCQNDDLIQDEIDDQISDDNMISEHYEAKLYQSAFSVNDEKNINGSYDYYPVMNIWTLNFFAKNTEGDVIEIFITDYKGPGTYHSGKNGNENYMYYSQKGKSETEGGPVWWSGESNTEELNELDDSGTVVITSENESFIEGTFHFEGYSNPGNFRSIKEGKFKVAVARDQSQSSNNIPEYFEAKFNEGSFSVVDENEPNGDDGIQGTYNYSSTTDKGALNLFAKNPAGELIEIYVSDYKGPGIYTSGKNGNENYMYYSTMGKRDADNNISTWWSGDSNSAESDNLDDSGTIEITTETDSYIEGTFSFTGYLEPGNYKKIQEGKFKVAIKR